MRLSPELSRLAAERRDLLRRFPETSHRVQLNTVDILAHVDRAHAEEVRAASPEFRGPSHSTL